MSTAEIIAATFGLVIIVIVIWNFRGSRSSNNDHENWTTDSDVGHSGHQGSGQE